MKARKRVVTAIDRADAWPRTAARREGRDGRPAPSPRAVARSPLGSRAAPATSGGGPMARATGGAGGPSGAVLRADADAGRTLAGLLDLTVDLGRGLLLRNPLVVASGAMGFGVELDDLLEPERIGALCTRGVTLRARTGNPPPRLARTPGGLLNGVGLQNAGVEAVVERYGEAWARWPAPVVLNLGAASAADFAELARRLEGVPGVAGLELNLGCPNSARGGVPFALDADAAATATSAVRRASDAPVIVKLSAAAPDLRAIARAVSDAGADAISAVNTLPAMALRPDRSAPLLGSGYGGLSGPALRPIALRAVHEIAGAVSIPVLAMGGVTSLGDVLDFLAVGASAVGVATAAIADPGLPARLADELADACQERGLPSHRPLTGTALARRGPAGPARAAEYRL